MIVGLIYGAHLVHVPIHWIVVGAIVLVVFGAFIDIPDSPRNMLESGTTYLCDDP